jgi:hypothetical protein
MNAAVASHPPAVKTDRPAIGHSQPLAIGKLFEHGQRPRAACGRDFFQGIFEGPTSEHSLILNPTGAPSFKWD